MAEKKQEVSRGSLLGAIVVITIVVVAFHSCTSGPPAPACNPTDLTCNGNAMISMADSMCKDKIEHLALHSVKWTDDGTGDIFSRFEWADEGDNAITFIGDKAQFQNGFGAYTNVVYECDVKFIGKTNDDYTDPDKYQVLDARIDHEGYIDN